MKKLNLNENFISRIWKDNLYYSDLKTTDGKKVEILDYGIANKDSGADYKNAKIKIEDNIYIGDVEIHKSFRDWEQHAHKRNGKYNKVVLQVVFWDEDFSEDMKLPVVLKSRVIPTVVLSKFLTKSIHEIWKEIINNPSCDFKIPCFPQNQKIDSVDKKQWLKNVSLKRIIYRASRLRQRLEKLEETEIFDNKKQIWEKLFFEYTLEALGFSKNKVQFLKFASNQNLIKIKKLNLSLLQIESLFFGSAGLLDNLKFKDNYIDKIKDNWKILNKNLNSIVMNKSEWNFFRLRPQNFPTIRIAYAASFCNDLINNNLLKKVILCFEKSKNTNKDLLNLFLDIQLSDYWKNHFVFGKKINKNIKSIGTDRIHDIINNVVLPLLYLYSERFSKNLLLEKVIEYYFSEKDKNENEITKIMQKQLMYKAITISEKQGLIHLHNFYCVKVKCDDCLIGKKLYGKEQVSDVLKIILY